MHFGFIIGTNLKFNDCWISNFFGDYYFLLITLDISVFSFLFQNKLIYYFAYYFAYWSGFNLTNFDIISIASMVQPANFATVNTVSMVPT